jgi:hypothetical protein
MIVGRNRNSDRNSGLGFGLSHDEARRLLNNANTKERGKLDFKVKWPTDDDAQRFRNAACSNSPIVFGTDGRRYSLKYCEHRIANTNPQNARCVFVQSEEGITPCGHFIY